MDNFKLVSKLFRAYGLYNGVHTLYNVSFIRVSKLFRAYGLYNLSNLTISGFTTGGFKALSSLRVI